ncbi:MAG TPA: SAM-dependent methyltransferase [Azospirillaceae bacterium]|nr:SAM-dependent methyltransferase [Azospirillaceae bacterium]
MRDTTVPGAVRQGRLTIVGSGIKSIAHLTREAIGHIRAADIVFHATADAISEADIRALNPNAVNLTGLYGSDKHRAATYADMAEAMLAAARGGREVVGVFYGHPGWFVDPAKKALEIADREGIPARMLPGISSVDCLLADLRVDPCVEGCQILDATDLLVRHRPVVTANHVVILQVGLVGTEMRPVGGSRPARTMLLERLISLYGAGHPSVLYVGAVQPGAEARTWRRPLGAYRDDSTLMSIPLGSTLYLPPRERLEEDQSVREALRQAPPAPAGGMGRPAAAPVLSAGLYDLLFALATDPAQAEAFRADPGAVLARHGLTEGERAVLLGRAAAPAIRAEDGPQHVDDPATTPEETDPAAEPQHVDPETEPLDPAREPQHIDPAREPQHIDPAREPQHVDPAREPQHIDPAREPQHIDPMREPQHVDDETTG